MEKRVKLVRMRFRLLVGGVWGWGLVELGEEFRGRIK